jgi:hypothetical protein
MSDLIRPGVDLSRILNDSLKANILAGAESNPDEVASDLKLSESLKIPAAVIGPTTRDGLKKTDAANTLQRKVEKSPALSQLIRENVDLSKILGNKDDAVDNVIKTEELSHELSYFDRMSGGMRVMEGLGYRALEAVSEITEEEEAIEIQASKAAQRAFGLAPPVMSIYDVDMSDPSSFLQWMKENSAQQLPLWLPSIIGQGFGTVVGAGIGSVLGPGGTVMGAMIGNRLGSFIPSFIMGMGEIQQGIREISPDIEAPGIVIAGGALIGALDSLLPGRIGSSLIKAFGLDITESILKMTARSLSKRAVLAGGKAMTLEGITESVQEAISIGAASLATDTPIDVDKLTHDMVNAFAVGTFMGGTVGTTASVATDVIKARRFNKTMKALDKLAQESKLRERNKEQFGEVTGQFLRDGGVTQFVVNTDMLIWWAEQQPNEDALASLNVADQLSNDEVVLTPETFSAFILGVKGYNQLIRFVRTPDGRSMESVSKDFSALENIEKMGVKLGDYPISDKLREKVLKTLQKFQTEDALEVFETMPPDVEAILNALFAEVETESLDVSEIILQGRLKQLDAEIEVKNREILVLEKEIAEAESKNRGTKRLEKKLTKALAEVESILEQQAQINLLPEEQEAILQEAEQIVGSTFTMVELDQTFTGTNHALAIEKAEEELGQEVVEEALNTLGATEEGFITSLGRVLDREQASEEFGIQIAEDVGEGKGAPAEGIKPPWEMTREELVLALENEKIIESSAEIDVFGEEGAKKYARLQRQANNLNNPEQADKASVLVGEMEDGLTPAQEQRLFGFGEEGPNAEELQDFVNALDEIGGDTAQELGVSLSRALFEIGDKVDPSKMRPDEQRAYAQLQEGARLQRENNFDGEEVLRSALQAAAKQFSDPADAEFMLERWLPYFAGQEEGAPTAETIDSPANDNKFLTLRLEDILREPDPDSVGERVPRELMRLRRKKGKFTEHDYKVQDELIKEYQETYGLQGIDDIRRRHEQNLLRDVHDIIKARFGRDIGLTQMQEHTLLTSDFETAKEMAFAAMEMARENIRDGVKGFASSLFNLETEADIANKDALTVDARDAALKAAKKKPIILTKGAILADLAIKINAKTVRAVRQGFNAGLGTAATLKEMQKIIRDRIKALPITDKQKLTQIERVDRVDTVVKFNRLLPLVRARLDNLVVKAQRKALLKAMKDQVKKTKVKGKEGKFDPEVQAYLDEIRFILSMPQKSIREKQHIEEIRNSRLETAEVNPDEWWKTMLYSLVLGDGMSNSVDAENFLIDIVKLKAQGTAASILRRNTRRMRIEADVDAARELISVGVPPEQMDTSSLAARWRMKIQAAGSIKDSMLMAWSDILDIAFNKKGVNQEIADRTIENLIPSDEIVNWKAANVEWEGRFLDLYRSVYGLKDNNKALNKMQDDSKVLDLGKDHQDKNGKTIHLQYSLAEIRKLWMERQDPELRKVFESKTGNAFTEPMMTALWAKMSNEDYKLAEGQLEIYREFYAQVNRVYRKRYGVDLPFNEFYSPIIRDKTVPIEGEDAKFGSEETLLSEFKFRRTIPRSLLARRKNEIALGKQNDIGVMYQHIHNMNWFIHVSEKVLHIKNVFKDEPLKAAIKAQHGDGFLKNINGFIDDFAVGHIKRGSEFDKFISGMNSRFAESVLALKPTIGFKQVVSWFAMADNIPTKDFMRYTGEFLKDRAGARKIIKFLYENAPGLQTRGNSLEFELARINKVADSVFNMKNQAKWRDWEFIFIRLGDRLPIYAGGWAVYQHAVAGGKTHEQAIRLFERTFNDTQQSTDIDKLSALQRNYAIGRTLTMFQSARLALIRGEMRAWRQSPLPLIGRNKISWFDFGKRIGYYHFAMPMLIQWMASGFEWDEERQIVAAVTGQLNSFIILGEYLTYTLMAIISDEKRYDIDTNLPLIAMVNEVLRGVYSVATEDWGTEDFLDGMRDIGSVVGKLTGKPIDQVMNWVGALSNIERDEIETGIKRFMGLSEKVARESSED